MPDNHDCQMAAVIRDYFIDFYRVNRLRPDIPLPLDSQGQIMSDGQIKIWRQEGWSLYYRPSTRQASFVNLMDSFSGTSSWTSGQMEIFQNASWHQTEKGYWFWVDAGWFAEKMVLFSQIRPEDRVKLLTIEEYIIFHHATDFPNPFIQDHPSWLESRSWLSTDVEGEHLTAKKGTGIEFADLENDRAYPRFVIRLTNR